MIKLLMDALTAAVICLHLI